MIIIKKSFITTFFLILLVIIGALNSPKEVFAQACIVNTICPGPAWTTTDPGACAAPCGTGTSCCVPATSNTSTIDCSGVNPLFYPECTFSVIGQLVVGIINALLIIGALGLLLNLFYSAFLYITSADNRDKTQKARLNVGWSFIGFLGLASMFALFRYIVATVPNLDRFIVF